MNTLNTQLVARLGTETIKAVADVTTAITVLNALPKYISSATFSPDFDLRSACEGDKMALNRILEGIYHGAWNEFFTNHDAHHLIIDRERTVQNVYVFSDCTRRKKHQGVKTLITFTPEAATDFYNNHLAVTPEKRIKWLNDLLDRTGKDYKNHSTEFKAKMSLRGLDSYGTVSSELGRAIFAVCLNLGIEFTFNSFYTELRNNNRIDGEQYKVVEGLDITFENHQNGNTTLRIGKDLVNKLNALIK